MKQQFNNLSKLNSNYKNEFIRSFKNIVKNSQFISGQEVIKFEKKFREINQSRYCISCANGSDALFIALKSLDVKPGDEVITTALSWIATSSSITMVGAKIIFCDIENDGFNINTNLIESKITKKTVGIIPVHLYGHPANIKKINQIAKKYKLWVIEDCAQAHMAEVDKKKVGNFGSFGTFSFFPGKNLGALGDAGCLVTNNKNLEKKARLIANHGGKGVHLIEGINSRMDNLHASFLNIKLKDLKKVTKSRRINAKYYRKYLKDCKHVKLPIELENETSVYHQFVILCKKRDELQKYLKKNNIETQIHYKKILPMLPAYKYLNLDKKKFLNASNKTNQILSLPCSPDKKKSDIFYISKKIIKFYQND